MQRVQHVGGVIETVVGQQVVGRVDVHAADQHHGVRVFAVVVPVGRGVGGPHVSPLTARVDFLWKKKKRKNNYDDTSQRIVTFFCFAAARAIVQTSRAGRGDNFRVKAAAVVRTSSSHGGFLIVGREKTV